MAADLPEPKSPVLANIVVMVGFVVLFTTFATDSPWSWIIGGAMVLAGGLWAGFTTSRAADGLSDPGIEGAEVIRGPDAGGAAATHGPDAEGAEQVHGPGTGGLSHGHGH